ncbi:MAG: phosphatase PAP2 family protein, partial [Friedmanniella sp.]
TTVVLAHTVSVGRVPFGDPTLWPSNHTTAVAAAGLCLPLILRGRLLLPAAAIAFGMTAAMPLMLLLRGTHLLSDVVAGQLVAGFWAVVAAQSGRRLKTARGSSLMASMTQRRNPGT